MSEKKILITPGSIKTAIEENLRLSRDLKNTMNKAGANLLIELDASGSVVVAGLKDLGGKIIANSAQMAGLGGIRRFVSDAVKQSEKESADASKLTLAKRMENVEAVSVKKLRPEANGKVSELIRMAHNAVGNRRIVEQWDDDGLEGLVKDYLLRMVNEVLELVKDEARALLKGGKPGKDFLEDELASRSIPIWFYRKFTVKGTVNINMGEPIDFLFPKNNYQNGISLRVCELKKTLLDKHWIITKGNEEIIYIVSKFLEDFQEPDGRDAKRQAKEYLKNIKILLRPRMKPVELIERYIDSTYKMVEQDRIPDGEAGHSLRKKVPTLNRIITAWNEYHRFEMLSETDVKSYWSFVVKDDTIDDWEITAYQNVKYWVKELESSDIILTESWERNVYDYILSKVGIYGEEERNVFLEKYAAYDHISCQEKHGRVLESIELSAESAKHMDEWLAELAKAEEKKIAEDFKKMNPKPYQHDVVDFYDIPSWEVVFKGDIIDVPVGNMEAKKGFFKKEFPGTSHTHKRILPEGGDDVEKFDPDERARLLKFFKGIQATDGKTSGAIGIADTLTETSAKLMLELKRNEKYGKDLEPKVKNWLVTTFAGAPKLQTMAAEAIVESLKNQDFFNEEEVE